MGRFPAWQKHSTSESSLMLPCPKYQNGCLALHSLVLWAWTTPSRHGHWRLNHERKQTSDFAKQTTKSGTAGARLDLIGKNWTQIPRHFPGENMWKPIVLLLASRLRLGGTDFSVRLLGFFGLRVCQKWSCAAGTRRSECLFGSKKQLKKRADFLLLSHGQASEPVWLFGHLGSDQVERINESTPFPSFRVQSSPKAPSTQHHAPSTSESSGKIETQKEQGKLLFQSQMGVSKNRGTPKWMVKIMENPIKHGMIWGVKKKPIFGSTPKWQLQHIWFVANKGTFRPRTPGTSQASCPERTASTGTSMAKPCSNSAC